MTRTVVSFVSAISWAERICAQMDWAEIRRIIRDGLVAFVALIILATLVTVESTVASYKWLQPRLANLLQHPILTLQHGPAALYNECRLAVMLGQSNTAERMIVRIGAFVILTVHTVKDTVAAIKQWQNSLTVATVSTWAKEQLIG